MSFALAPRHRSTGRLSDAAALPASPLERPQMHRTRRNYDGPPARTEEELTRRIRAALQRQPPLPEHVLEAVIDILRRGEGDGTCERGRNRMPGTVRARACAPEYVRHFRRRGAHAARAGALVAERNSCFARTARGGSTEHGAQTAAS